MNLQITKEKVLEAASKCTIAESTLKVLFPEAFEKPKLYYPLIRGDVYVHPSEEVNSFLLVEALYEGDERFSLLGRGCAPNSNEFHYSLRSKEAIADYLEKHGMLYSHNINNDVYKLLKPGYKIVP